MNRLIAFIIIGLTTLATQGEMLHVVEVVDGRTLAVERAGKREIIRLAGIAIEPQRELEARELLRWSVGTAWILAEPLGEGHLVYRSPDALFVNRELVGRGYARATLPGIEPSNRVEVVYLGQFDPGPIIQEPERKSGSDTSRRPKAAPRRSSRSRAGAKTAGGSGRASSPAPHAPAGGKGAPPPRRSPD